MDHITIGVLILGIIVGLIVIVTLHDVIDTIHKKQWSVYDAELPPSEEIKTHNDMIDYSQKVTDYIHHFVTEIAIIEYQKFMDSHTSVESITRTQFEKLVKQVATVTYENLMIERIDTEHLVYKPEFIEKLIPNMCAHVLKGLLAKELYSVKE